MNQYKKLSIWVTAMAVAVMGVSAQAAVNLSGRAYIDYRMTNASSDFNKFDIGRFYVMGSGEVDPTTLLSFTADLERDATGGTEFYSWFFKTAYLEKTDLLPGAKVRLGMQGTPWVSTVEKAWGYRFVEKTMGDFKGYMKAVDLGIGVLGNVSKELSYHVVLSNGNGGTGIESDQGKDLDAAATFKLSDQAVLTGIYHMTGSTTVENRIGLTGAVALSPLSVGGEFLMITDGTTNKQAISAFGSFGLTDTMSVFGRFDSNDPDTATASDGAQRAQSNVRFWL